MTTPHRRAPCHGPRNRRDVCWLLAAALAIAGCGTTAPEAAPPTSGPSTETWDALYIRGAKVGYAHTTEEHVVVDGQTLVHTTQQTLLVLQRFQDRSEQSIDVESWESADGRLLRFTEQLRLGQVPAKRSGRVEGNQLIIELLPATGGQKPGAGGRQTLAWDATCGGFFAPEQSLRAKPMRPGEKRSLRSLAPVLDQVASVDLEARDYEPTPLLAGTFDLLRIESRIRLPGGQTIDSTMWTDRAGQVLKTQMPALEQVSYRVPRQVALAENVGASFDLGQATLVRLAEKLPAGHATRSARYRLTLRDGDPGQSFAHDDVQQLTRLGPHAAEAVVAAIRPDSPPPGIAPTPPTEADAGPSSLVQSDEASIATMAREAAATETDPWRVAVRLEKHVRDNITAKNFNTAFATAAEVARSREGDCTEHAVLLVALLRARGIPARGVVGLVYIEALPGFGFHMWTEAWIADRWIPLDATLGLGGTGADRLKLASTSLSGPEAFATFLTVANVLGQLKIETLRAD